MPPKNQPWVSRDDLEVQGSFNQTITVLLPQLKNGQLYLRGLEVVDNCSYGLVITTLDLQVESTKTLKPKHLTIVVRVLAVRKLSG